MVRPAGTCTCTGTDEFVVLFPNWPKEVFPRPRRCHRTQAPQNGRRRGELGDGASGGICTCCRHRRIRCGVVSNCPELLYSQAQTVPSDASAQSARCRRRAG